MKKLNKIKIGNNLLYIDYVNPVKAKEMFWSEHIRGLYSIDSDKIMIDKYMAKEKTEKVLLHELTHVILKQLNHKLWKNEVFVSKLADMIYQINSQLYQKEVKHAKRTSKKKASR
jgi:hypothetical protein